MHNATPIPGSPRTRDRIIASVSDLFYRNGTYLVGVDAIVTHVKITRATFYRLSRARKRWSSHTSSIAILR